MICSKRRCSCRCLFSVSLLPAMVVVFSVAGQATAQDPNWASLPYTTHGELQGVNYLGQPTFDPEDFPIKMRGIVLNNYDEMLNNTANYGVGMGGEWQVYFQSCDVSDTSGTALYMAQNYGVIRGDTVYNYSDEDWNAEVARLSWLVDPNDPDPENPTLPLVELRAGALVEVHARGGLPYKGKYNVNEMHYPDPENNFDIVLIDPDYGLPAPLEIEMSDFMSGGAFLFDQTRTTGAELYQSRWVTLQNVTITNSDNWKLYGDVTVSDGTQEFTVKLGHNEAFDTAALPQGPIDITGIFDQEDGYSAPFTGGYRMWACRPEAFAPHETQILGDANADGVVNEEDAKALALHWRSVEGASWFDGDFNADGYVDERDASILASHWGQIAPPEQMAVPEPATSALLAAGALMILAAGWRRRLKRGPVHQGMA